jgi:hypothetical protein
MVRAVQFPLKLFFLCLFCVTAAYGQDHRVGRVSISFESSDWVAVEIPDKGVNYAGDSPGTISSETRLFVNKKSDLTVQSLLVVRASKGGTAAGASYFHYSPHCQHSQAMFSQGNKGFQQSFAQCLLVYPLFTADSLVKQLSANEAEILKSSRLVLPDAMQLISAYYANSNGSFVEARILLAPRFKGLVSPENTGEKAVFEWAKAFMAVTKSGVNSFLGRIKIPPVEFSNDTVEKSLAHLNLTSNNW